MAEGSVVDGNTTGTVVTGVDSAGELSTGDGDGAGVSVVVGVSTDVAVFAL